MSTDAIEMPSYFSKMIDNETDHFVPKFEAALNKIFDRFDSNADGYMSRPDIVNFTAASNGVGFDEDELDEIILYFAMDADAAKEANIDPELACKQLSRGGFLDFFHLQTLADPRETMRDLRRLGFNEDFDLVHEDWNVEKHRAQKKLDGLSSSEDEEDDEEDGEEDGHCEDSDCEGCCGDECGSDCDGECGTDDEEDEEDEE
ncbi:hypothetical protein H696_00886 [Fonticula alba]|uniref:EF-hand domain-containing protein n=1 Tax=Fonticula alba TaxID=691883 RepID=A0A058ZIK0_FONAL|nr:hypothetical protein H696_00886 [Fonticula alba]KCV73347.1 hypothetical protein H696_00886 [Fonticula alba]|eukprot:XP_009493048.1 hypothetical protein H696_00886 [Fonticula alba]